MTKNTNTNPNKTLWKLLSARVYDIQSHLRQLLGKIDFFLLITNLVKPWTSLQLMRKHQESPDGSSKYPSLEFSWWKNCPSLILYLSSYLFFLLDQGNMLIIILILVLHLYLTAGLGGSSFGWEEAHWWARVTGRTCRWTPGKRTT